MEGHVTPGDEVLSEGTWTNALRTSGVMWDGPRPLGNGNVKRGITILERILLGDLHD